MARGTDPISRIVQNLFTIQRLGNSIQAEGQVLLDALFDNIAADIELIDPAGASIQRWRRFRTNRLIERVEERLAAVFPEWERVIQRQLARAGASQGAFAEGTLINAFGTAIAEGVIKKTPITVARANVILTTEPFGGIAGKHVLSEWASGLEALTRQRIVGEIRAGMIAEESISEMVRSVRGARAGTKINALGRKVPNYIGGVWTSTTRDSTAIVRTAVTSISATAQLETYQKNAEVLLGIQYSATLDDRTCFVAGTMVLTPEGYRPIEEIREGDWVIGGSRTPCQVKGTRTQVKDEMARVTLSNGQTIECTAEHFWLTAAQEWVETRELKLGKPLAERREYWSGNITPEEILQNGWLEDKPEHMRADGGPGEVYVDGVEIFQKPTTVYDIHVGVDRCFIVADVVVHNTDICLGLDGTIWPVNSPKIVVPGVGTHFSCRSSLVPVPDYEKFGLTPPKDGFRKARDLSGLTDEELRKKISVRRRWHKEEQKNFLGKQKNIRSSTTAEGWMKDQSQRVQDKMLGKGKAQLFRDGKITLKDMVRDDLSTIPLSELLGDV